MSEPERAHVIRGRRCSSVLDDDDLLWEILLRLSPQPSSLPRASAVCKQWRRLTTDPVFLRRFCEHHREPPLLGVFGCDKENIVFAPSLGPPDRIPSVHFDLGPRRSVLGCHHGRVLIGDYIRKQVIVCDPITGEQCRVAVPLEFRRDHFCGAVLCAASDQGHVHGACHSSPFKVILVSTWCYDDGRTRACVYSSETGAWGNIISTAFPRFIWDAGWSGLLVGNALYWLCGNADCILEFDLKKLSLAIITAPPIPMESWSCHIIQAEDDAIGFAALSYPRFQMWQRNSNGHDVPTWVLWKNIEIHNILELPHHIDRRSTGIYGYSQDTDEIFILVEPNNVYLVQLRSMQSKRLHGIDCIMKYHAFTSFCTPGNFSSIVLILSE
ncbi:hypothetical protein CFC21_045268 [Triticum aestivum]|uniref:Uncharacterized protein n=2 Tax=Triticum aestivum TaxID=4565 RepID=A0A3B6GLA8_WHEAT|nr:hypothetical protein CFC21_045268 [Triticum aestivum]